MKKSSHRIMIGAVLVLCFGWMAGVGWSQFGNMSEDRLLTHRSETVKQQMTDCTGSFKERYDCKEEIVLEGKHTTLLNMMVPFVIVFGPPLALGIAFRFFVASPRFSSRTLAPGTEGAGDDPDEWLRQTRKNLPPRRRRG
ncbi:MAG: hypothetical protein FD149_1886 [Rhodospirillaceae bacterium]|nr:MAG: hypothetical protein FD149_1886 [Rhodospirillaceae bacterium]